MLIAGASSLTTGYALHNIDKGGLLIALLCFASSLGVLAAGAMIHSGLALSLPGRIWLGLLFTTVGWAIFFFLIEIV